MLIQILGNKKALRFPTVQRETRRCVLFLPGFPKYPEKNDIISWFINHQIPVLMPMYTGSFESGGTFSIENSVQDIGDWYQYLLQGKIGYQLDIDGNFEQYQHHFDEIIIFGVSFGCLIEGLSLMHFDFPKTSKMFFLSPIWNMSQYQENENWLLGADKTTVLMEKAFNNSYRFQDKKDFFQKIKGLGIVNQRNFIKNRNITKYILHGKQDTVTPLSMGQELALQVPNSVFIPLDGGHSSKVNLNQLFTKLSDIL